MRIAAHAVPRAIAALVACALALLLAAAVPAARAGEAPAPSDMPDAPDVAAAQAAVSSSPGELVDTFVAGREQSQGLAVAVSSGGGQAVERYFGFAGGAAVAADTAFEWGRCADLIVWACVMQLVEDGAFALDDAVAGLLPEGVALPEGYERLTLLDLMNHAAGLDVAMNGARTSIPDGTVEAAAALALFDVEAEYDPGDIVAYTPYDALLAAVAVETAAGVPFVDYARANVLDALGMEDTYLMVGGSAARMARQGTVPTQLTALATGTPAPGGTIPQTAASSVLTCAGTVSDLLKLANALMGLGDAALFDDPATVDALFGVTRTYPSLGVERIAHGMFAFPFTAGVYGMSASTSSGFSASVYMDRATGLAVAIMVNQAGRADLVQGIPRVLVGRTDAAVTSANAPANGAWTGTYQDASAATHGPAKLLASLGRVEVSLNPQGVLMFDWLTATPLGAGVYSIDSTRDQDAYRFHVDLERGSEFSRVGSDFVIVPWSTLAVERLLLGSFAVALVAALGYTVAGACAWVRVRIAHRRARSKPQPTVLLLAAATFAAGTVGVAAALRLAEGLAPATLSALLIAEGAYVACALAMGVWLVVTRWRSPRTWTARQHVACVAMLVAATVVILNLVYWELLP